MASVDLVFAGEPLHQPANLVFGDDGSSPVKDAIIQGDLGLPEVAFTSTVHLGYFIQGDLTIPTLAFESNVIYNSATERPLVARASVRFQDAEPQPERVDQHFQDGVKVPSAAEVRFQDAKPLQVGRRFYWQEANRQQRQWLRTRFQDGVAMSTSVRENMQNGRRAPNSICQRFENALPVSRGLQQRFQDGKRTPNVQRVRYQDAVPLQIGVKSTGAAALKLQRGWTTRYQEAIPPRPGRTILHPVVPPVDPCYIPDPNLVFEALWSNDTNLVFVCETHGPGPEPEPGETIVVPVKKVYVVLNTATLHRVDGNVLLPTFSMSMSLDVDSWTWSFSASLPGRALPDLEPDSDGTPVLVEATINAVPYRFLVEKIGRERAFASDGLRVTGRGIAAELDAPIAPIQSFGNTIDRTAQQLMGDVLTLNGVPLPGWTVDWQMEDWLVAANAWKKQGTYIEALNEIVAAAGGYLQPTPASKTVRALPRYPALPWDWADVTPDYELPSSAFTRESIDWTEKARYDRVYVSGQGTGGRLVNVRRAGTAGEIVAPMVTDALITDTIAGRQRGGAILADTGRIANYSLRGAAGVRDVDNNPVGIIPPGKFVLYTDNGVEKLGITRSVSVEVQMPDIWQTIGVETHE